MHIVDRSMYIQESITYLFVLVARYRCSDVKYMLEVL